MVSQIIKCAYCGEAFSSFNPRKINKCRFCGSINYISDNDQISERFHQAQNRIATYKFNKADEIYFDIFNEAKTTSVKAMALLGRILAYFGVVYIRSSVQEEYVVTFSNYHQEVNDIVSFDLVKELFALDLSQEERKEYQEKVEHLNKEYLLVREQLSSKKEYDFFICVKISRSLASNNYEKGFTQDSKQAEALYQELTSKGVKVFYSAKSLGGVDSDSQILSALIRSRNIIVISSSLEYLESPWVQSEWRRWINFIDVGQKEKDSFFLYVMNNIELPYVLKERRVQIISSYPTLMELLNEKTNPKSLQEQKNIRDIEENIDKLNEEFNSSKLDFNWCDRLDKIAKRIKDLGTAAASISNYSTFEDLNKNIKLIRRDLAFDKEIDKLSKIKNKNSYRFAKKTFKLDKKIKKNNALFCQKMDLFNEYLALAKRKEKTFKGFKIARRILIPLSIVVVIVGLGLLAVGYIVRPLVVYNYAMEDIKNGNYESAASYLESIKDCTFINKDIEHYYIVSESISSLDKSKKSYESCVSGDYCKGDSLDYTDTLKFMLDNDFEITVTYDADGGETSATTEVLTSPTISITATKSNRVFTGWAIKDFSIPTEKNSGYKATITFIATYQDEEFQISYDLDEGETEETLPSKYSYGEEIEIPNPTKKGYEFVGWKVNDSDEYFKDYRIKKEDSGNLNLVAVFTPATYRINFILNGGTLENNVTSIDVTYGSKVTLPIPELKGNNFIRWINKEDGKYYDYEEGSSLEFTFNFDKDIQVEAYWDLIYYNITYSYLTNDSKDIIGYYPESLLSDSYSVESTMFISDTAGGFSHEGYRLVKWIDDQKNEVESIKEGTIGDLHLTGILEPIEYQIKFETEITELKNNPITVTFNEAYIVPDDYKDYREGYTLEWVLNNEKFDPQGTYLYPNDIELTPNYIANKYNINYVFNTTREVINPNSNQFTYDKEKIIDDAILKDSKFEGWYLDEGFTKKISSISPNTYAHDIVLYAKWDHIERYITFKTGTKDYIINGQYYIFGDIFSKPTFPADLNSRGGFAGYYLDSEYTYPFKFDQPICTNMNLYSKFIKGTFQINSTKEIDSSPTPSANYFAIPEDATYIISLTHTSSNQETRYEIVDENDNIIFNSENNITGMGEYTFELNLEHGKKYGIKAYSVDESRKGNISCIVKIKEGTGYPNSVSVGFEQMTVYYLQEFTLPTYFSIAYELDYFAMHDSSGKRFEYGEGNVYPKDYDLNLYPIFKEKKYTITYELDGGVNNENNVNEFTSDKGAELHNPTKLGYKFIGWYDENNKKVTSINEGVARDVVLTARFSPNTYSYTILSSADNLVYYEDESGKHVLDGLNYESGIKLPNPAKKDGYYFTGWEYDKTKAREKSSSNGEYYILGEVTFKARYKEITSVNDLYLQNEYTINMKDGLDKNTFIFNDYYRGYSTLNIVSMSGSDSITVYLFATNENVVSYEVTISKPGNYRMNLTNIKRVVFYSTNNTDNQIVFSFSDVNSYFLYSYTKSILQGSALDIDKSIYERVNPGYEVECFLYNGNPIDTTFTYGEDVTFTIKWMKKDTYTVNYYDMDGNLLDLTKYPGLITEYKVGEDVLLETIYDENNNKLNYYTNKYVSKSYLIDSIPSSNYLDIDIYVDSSVQYYNVTYHYLFNGNELTNLQRINKYESNSNVSLYSGSAPYSDKYSYLGYNDNQTISLFYDIDCTQPVNDNDVPNENIDIYIPCEEELYKVRFITNLDNVSDSIVSVKYNETFELNSIETNDPSKVFVGWKRSDNEFYPTSVTSLTYNSNYNYQFTAVYLTQEEFILYNLDEGNEVEIGSFPQSKVTDAALISKLNGLISGSYPVLSTGATAPWHHLYSNEYEFATYWTYYQDVTYDNENYRLVYKIKVSDGSTLSAWFKFDPVVYDVVKKADNNQSIELISKYVIDRNNSHNLTQNAVVTSKNAISSTYKNSLPTFNTLAIDCNLPNPELLNNLDQNSKYATPEGRIKTATDYAIFLRISNNDKTESDWYLSKYGLYIKKDGLFDGIMSNKTDINRETNYNGESLAYYLKISI